jgi:molybdopterin molybdotransferase
MLSESNQPLLEVADAQNRLIRSLRRTEVVRLPIQEAGGRVLAEDIYSPVDYPLFPNSSMDGFAVIAADTQAAGEHPVELKVIGDIPAGVDASSIRIQSGQAARIMTGAMTPIGATAVVPVEDTDFPGGRSGALVPATVKIMTPARNGGNIRPKGMDLHAGDLILHASARLRAQDLGLLAMLGRPEVDVYQKPRVAILSTGDELLPIDAPLEPGKIHDSNSVVLATLVDRLGGEALALGIVPDYESAVAEALDRACDQRVDLILSSAGVSVGAFDFVRSVVEKDGRLEFWRVNMRPGKPVAFGEYRGIPFIGLPGNPVSAYVGFEVFVRAALLVMGGLSNWKRRSIPVQVEEEIQSDGRESYLRAVVSSTDQGWTARLTGHQGSGNLRSLVQGNSLLIIPSGVKSVPIGSIVQAWIFDEER